MEKVEQAILSVRTDSTQTQQDALDLIPKGEEDVLPNGITRDVTKDLLNLISMNPIPVSQVVDIFGVFKFKVKQGDDLLNECKTFQKKLRLTERGLLGKKPEEEIKLLRKYEVFRSEALKQPQAKKDLEKLESCLQYRKSTLDLTKLTENEVRSAVRAAYELLPLEKKRILFLKRWLVQLQGEDDGTLFTKRFLKDVIVANKLFEEQTFTQRSFKMSTEVLVTEARTEFIEVFNQFHRIWTMSDKVLRNCYDMGVEDEKPYYDLICVMSEERQPTLDLISRDYFGEKPETKSPPTGLELVKQLKKATKSAKEYIPHFYVELENYFSQVVKNWDDTFVHNTTFPELFSPTSTLNVSLCSKLFCKKAQLGKKIFEMEREWTQDVSEELANKYLELTEMFHTIVDKHVKKVTNLFKPENTMELRLYPHIKYVLGLECVKLDLKLITRYNAQGDLKSDDD
ncbi:hypothetical protein EIN_221900 [Entamoeba invadens IP1]|uniref:Uncharacterized protein n=1 Tax=Entamoeba invadens IP1 TaxID=370355 RepID=A0A0A1U1Z2_ENTIV|nr:hypothetical protein EIN_221900 [Entamoeba invadens IP1]ELP88057.1 hypothetical protein EIN_221900 [Entamoeba invadens IP1]|eukprot:XP_004254828.1 hypothetical protein EIN_221900 [Entamoeba invadens IP1]